MPTKKDSAISCPDNVSSGAISMPVRRNNMSDFSKACFGYNKSDERPDSNDNPGLDGVCIND